MHVHSGFRTETNWIPFVALGELPVRNVFRKANFLQKPQLETKSALAFQRCPLVHGTFGNVGLKRVTSGTKESGL